MASLWLRDLIQYRGLLLMIFVLGIGGSFQYGFHISVLNSPSLFIKEFINDTWIHHYSKPMGENSLRILWSFIVSSYCIGGMLGSLWSGYFTSKYGKSECFVCICFMPLLTALLVGCSRTSKSFEMILIGRFLYGINAGFGFNIHSQYAGEIAHKKLRGFTNTSISIFVTIGKLMGQILGLSEILGTKSKWPLLLGLNGMWALVQMVALPFFPESPYLLIERNDKDGCMKALKQLWGDRDHERELEEMMKEQAARKSDQSLTVKGLLEDRSLRWQIYMLIALTIALQLCGVNAIYFYAAVVFEEAKFDFSQIPYLTIGIGVCESSSVILCSLLVDRFGRRVLLLGGYIAMVLSLSLLIATLSLQDTYMWLPYCSVMLIFLYVLSFGTGPGATTMTIIVELFPQEARAAAFVIVGIINWIGLFVIGMVFPLVEATLGPFCFLIFITITAACAVFLYIYLPETKGKSALEIKEDINKDNLRKKNHLEIPKHLSNISVLSTKL
ncbi:solute carrier family 2, facilitated glucose transporter member 11-like [Pelobates cultripes]|uniref:Solute carrier family 2, facilitated glucose transporter member 5 n=1 Tax=Pelobates cultripes TaxID=61616 RepID=A0AAD1SC21_PELCU|nr:solute carrier family 2, facilitated glucose transporter member 11-like [Pelobates cultripes]